MAAAVSPSPGATAATPYGFAGALKDAVPYLAMRSFPGQGVGAIDSVSYVKTTAAGAASLLGIDVREDVPGGQFWPVDGNVWLFVEYGEFWLHSAMMGGSSGGAITQWVLAAAGFDPLYSTVAGSIDLSRLGVPVVIPRGQVPEIDELRVPDDFIVHTATDAVRSVARLFPKIRARISAISWIRTTAARAAPLTGVSAAGLPDGTPAWLFDVHGDFQFICGGMDHEGAPAVRLLVIEGRAAPYLLRTSTARFPTPTPTPELSAFGSPILIAPGDWPAIDQFREPEDEIEATATAIARTPIVPCN